MQLPENRRYVVASSSAGDQTCGGVLDRLKPLHQSVSNYIHASYPGKSKDQRALVAFTEIIEFVEFFKHLTPVMIICWRYLVTVGLSIIISYH